MTVAVPWEDRDVSAARGALYAELREVKGASVEQLGPHPEFTRSATLFEVERRFGEPPRWDPIARRRLELLAGG